MHFFNHLESLYYELNCCHQSETQTKEDVAETVCNKLQLLFGDFLSTPYMGTAFMHPSDALCVDGISTDTASNHIHFELDECKPAT
eukprot:577224-Rhodomonas_salina.3